MRPRPINGVAPEKLKMTLRASSLAHAAFLELPTQLVWSRKSRRTRPSTSTPVIPPEAGRPLRPIAKWVWNVAGCSLPARFHLRDSQDQFPGRGIQQP